MNRIYWIYSFGFKYISGPLTLREAMRAKAQYDNDGEAVLILKTVIDAEGREVK